MATKVTPDSVPLHGRINWTQWCDGEWWELDPDVDHPGRSATRTYGTLRQWCAAHGLKLEARNVARGPLFIRITRAKNR